MNTAEAYGVEIIPASASGPVWRAVNVRHLLPEENRGRHNIYVDALDEQGRRVSNPALRIGWTWKGRREGELAPPAPLDKGAGEPAGNIPIFWGQVVSVWIEGSDTAQGDFYPSDIVAGMHTAHLNEGEGNTTGHHSFHAVFQLAESDEQEPELPPGPTVPDQGDQILVEVEAALERCRQEIRYILARYLG